MTWTAAAATTSCGAGLRARWRQPQEARALARAVAVRSSATSEDSKDTSFAGMNSTFTNVRGEDELIEAVFRYHDY